MTSAVQFETQTKAKNFKSHLETKNPNNAHVVIIKNDKGYKVIWSLKK